MPIVFTYDLEDASTQEHNRLQSLFERLGWQALGGSAYRYPPIASKSPVEDWFNSVIPALMAFRCFVLKSGRPLSRCTIDVQSSTGFEATKTFGQAPVAGGAMNLVAPKQKAFGEKNLRTWLDGIEYPY